MEEFKDILYRARKERKLSQEQLAEELGVTRQTISDWERGISTPLGINYQKLCDVFHDGKGSLFENKENDKIIETSDDEITDMDVAEVPNRLWMQQELKETLTEIHAEHVHKRYHTMLKILLIISGVATVVFALLTGIAYFILQEGLHEGINIVSSDDFGLNQFIIFCVLMFVFLILLCCLVIYFIKNKKRRNDRGALDYEKKEIDI